jgi:hypothetical protein
MKLIAIQNKVDVYSPNGMKRIVDFGLPVGEYQKNNFDGTITLKSGELVNIDSVAISNETEIEPTTFEENIPQTGNSIAVNQTKQKQIRRNIGFVLVALSTYFIFIKGRKSIGITMLVFGLIMLKRNQK